MINTLCIQPDWPAPKHIRAFSTLRQGGMSPSPYDSLNLATSVNDAPQHVAQNRRILQQALNLPSEPIWMEQIHSNIIITAQDKHRNQQADASYTDVKNTVCAVLTADCLPILLCNAEGSFVSAIHAGWRGLQKNIIDATLDQLPCDPKDIMAWFGPAIGPTRFEVGPEVKDLFVDMDKSTAFAFIHSTQHKYLCDIYAIAALQLRKRSVNQIYGGTYCTYSDPHKFYSYRRDGANTGRMASLIWINDH